MHYAALGAGQADVFQTRSSSLRTRVKDVVTRAVWRAIARSVLWRSLWNQHLSPKTDASVTVLKDSSHRARLRSWQSLASPSSLS